MTLSMTELTEDDYVPRSERNVLSGPKLRSGSCPKGIEAFVMSVEERRPSTSEALPVDINRCDVKALLRFRGVLLLP